ncbi:hypothetical protein MMC08_007434 [Hypocenomyce scalaris]|nr:hypothetical protein [Hypocenomyce scalaris]
MESTEGVQFGLDDRLSSTLPELRKELQQLLAQEDRFITKYERVHNVLHANERKMRTATAEVIFVVLQVFKDIASEEMKRLSTIVKEVVARRREVLNEDEIVELEKAEATVARRTAVLRENVELGETEGP